MNLINSVTSGMNINFGNGFFNSGFNNASNINIDGNYENDDDILARFSHSTTFGGTWEVRGEKM